MILFLNISGQWILNGAVLQIYRVLVLESIQNPLTILKLRVVNGISTMALKIY